MPSVCPASAPRVSGVGPARSAHGWRPSGMYIHASSSAHSFVHAQKSRRTQRTTTNAQRWSSALDARVAHGDAHPANDDALAKMDTFSARRPCVVPVWLARLQCSGTWHTGIWLWTQFRLWSYVSPTRYSRPIDSPSTLTNNTLTNSPPEVPVDSVSHITIPANVVV